MRMRTCGLLYHKKASDSSVYSRELYISGVNISYVMWVAPDCVVTLQSCCLEPEMDFCHLERSKHKIYKHKFACTNVTQNKKKKKKNRGQTLTHE